LDVAAFGGKLRAAELISSPAWIADLAAKARHKAASYTRDQMAAGYLAAYSQALQRAPWRETNSVEPAHALDERANRPEELAA